MEFFLCREPRYRILPEAGPRRVINHYIIPGHSNERSKVKNIAMYSCLSTAIEPSL
jgi:hypothetical protein